MNAKYNLLDVLSMLTCVLTILWRPITNWIIPVDMAGRSLLFLLIISSTLIILSYRKGVMPKPLIIYFILALYMMINGYAKGGYQAYSQDGVYLLFWDSITAVLFMTILIHLFRFHIYKAIKYISISLWLFSLFFLIFGQIDEFGRLGGAINSNEAAMYAAISFFFLIIQFVIKQLTLPKMILLSLVPLVAVVLSASRMAIGMCLIVMLPSIIICSNIKKISSLIRLSSVLLVLGVITYYTIDHTLVGERIAANQEEKEDAYWRTDTPLDILGDRGIAYYNSWPLFLESPITGIGFQNWRLKNKFGFRAHSEYIVMYVENGLIAFGLYVFFIVLIFIGIHRGIKQSTSLVTRHLLQILLFSMIAILFANFVLWSFNLYSVFTIYALSIALAPQKVIKA